MIVPEQYNTPLSLANVCEGALDEAFCRVYPQVLAAMRKGQKASISITIKMERPENLDTLVNIGYELGPRFPRQGKIGIAQITGEGGLKVEVPKEKVVQLNLMPK